MSKDEMYHMYKYLDSNYLYLTNYKQVFGISNEEYNSLRNEKKNLNKYINAVNSEDRKDVCKSELNQYGIF